MSDCSRLANKQPCTHDERFGSVIGALNGCVACELESVSTQLRRLEAIIDEHLHRRRCWECGNEAWHKDNAGEWVRCAKCKSMDTRKVKS